MTLTSFPPDMLDELALRLLDIAAIVRKMANTGRENAIRDFQLHGNKAQEWLDHLERWAYEAAGTLDAEVLRQKGMRRGQIGAAAAANEHSRSRGKSRKKGS